MCIAAPGEIVEIDGREVKIKYPGVDEVRRAMVGIGPSTSSGKKGWGSTGKKGWGSSGQGGLRVGDLVMVQMGVVIRVLNQEEASEVKKAWEVVGGN